jgi:glyoxylate/hydroxypyruvate reductase A
MLVVKADGARTRQQWCELLSEMRPGLVAKPFDAPDLRAEEATYVLTWEPNPGWLASLPNLRAIFSLGAGVDHITRDPSWPRAVPLVRMGGEEVGQRMGEYIAWACLTLLRNGRDFAIAQSEKRWAYKVGEDTARDLTVGIMGLGTLGAAVVPMLRRLGYRVAGWSRSRKEVEGAESFVGEAELDAFLARSNVLVCLLPATAETAGIVNAGLLAKLPTGAGFVNVGRGAHVVMPDLVAAIESGQVSGAVLDVFDPEPLPAESLLWSHPRITITPHVASVARRRARARYVADAIAAFEAGGTLPNLYDPMRGY